LSTNNITKRLDTCKSVVMRYNTLITIFVLIKTKYKETYLYQRPWLTMECQSISECQPTYLGWRFLDAHKSSVCLGCTRANPIHLCRNIPNVYPFIVLIWLVSNTWLTRGPKINHIETTLYIYIYIYIVRISKEQ